MKHLSSLLFICSSFSLYSMQLETLPQKSLFVPSKLGNLKVLTDYNKFYIQKNNSKTKKIQNYEIDPLLRELKPEQLKSFLSQGYLSVSQHDNGEYELKAHGRLNGGGPVSGWIGYWGTKALAWGTVSLAATASVKALAAKAGISIGAKTAVAGAKMLTGAKGIAVTAGEEVVEHVIGEAGAKTLMGSIAAHVPGAVFLATKIEAAATTVGTALTICPWLP